MVAAVCFPFFVRRVTTAAAEMHEDGVRGHGQRVSSRAGPGELRQGAAAAPSSSSSSMTTTDAAKHLIICSNVDYGWNFVEMPCLRSAVIDFWEYDGDRDFAKFLAGLQVTKLKVYFYEPVNRIKMLEALPYMFDNLVNLKLLINFCELAPILSIFRYLRSAPNLEKLKILICRNENQDIEATEEFLNAQWVDGMCAKPQVLQITGINWLPNEMSFAKFILSKARLLHNLSVSHADGCLVSHEEPLLELQNAQELRLKVRSCLKVQSDQLIILDRHHLLHVTKNA